MRRLLILVIALMAAFTLVAMSVDAATSSAKKSTVKSKSAVMSKAKPKARVSCRMVCTPVKHHRYQRYHKRVPRVRAGAGPVRPIVNVPQQPAPVVNVPQQAAPVVNVAAPPPGVGITTDQCNIYVVRGDELMVIDKNTMCVTKKSTLSGSSE